MNKKSDRRDELLKMAAQVFYEKGFAQTTLQDIADRMNFTKPAIYYYANSKEALFVEIYEGIVVGAIERARVEAQTAGSGRAIREADSRAHANLY